VERIWIFEKQLRKMAVNTVWAWTLTAEGVSMVRLLVLFVVFRKGHALYGFAAFSNGEELFFNGRNIDSMRRNPSGRWAIWLSHGPAHTEYAFHGHGAQIMTLHDRRPCWWTRLWRTARKRSIRRCQPTPSLPGTVPNKSLGHP